MHFLSIFLNIYHRLECLEQKPHRKGNMHFTFETLSLWVLRFRIIEEERIFVFICELEYSTVKHGLLHTITIKKENQKEVLIDFRQR
jgi:hypothetical protein